jgi:hypothetical protein
MKVVAALVPFLGMFVVFVVVLRAILFSDRREREAMKRLEESDVSRPRGPVAPGSDRPLADLTKKGFEPDKTADA